MKGFSSVIITGLIAFGALSIALVYKYFYNAKADDPVEVVCEKVIEKELGPEAEKIVEELINATSSKK